MAKDDYHVIVYKILAYLYTQLKHGEPVDAAFLKHDGKLFSINPRYWNYIMENMLDRGYIRGILVEKTWGRDVIISCLEDCEITPEGIEYLCDNSFLERAKNFLKDIKEITPFI